MDFTYFIAALIALIVGFCASLVFVLIHGHSKLHLIAFALMASLVINGLVLIDWAYGDLPAGFLLLDFGLITAYSLVGCVIGTLPALGVRSIWRWRTKRVE